MCYAYARAYDNDALWLSYEAPRSEIPAERFEAESMRVLAKRNCATNPQRANERGGKHVEQGRTAFLPRGQGRICRIGLHGPSGRPLSSSCPRNLGAGLRPYPHDARRQTAAAGVRSLLRKSRARRFPRTRRYMTSHAGRPSQAQQPSARMSLRATFSSASTPWISSRRSEPWDRRDG